MRTGDGLSGVGGSVLWFYKTRPPSRRLSFRKSGTRVGGERTGSAK